MPSTTEILVCPLSAGSDIGDQQNEAAKVLKEVGGTLKTTDGVQQIQFGTTVEKSDVFELHVGKFTSSLRLEQIPPTMTSRTLILQFNEHPNGMTDLPLQTGTPSPTTKPSWQQKRTSPS